MKKDSKIIDLIAEKTSTGFSAYSDSYLIFTTGKALSELMKNTHEATFLYVEAQRFKIDLIHS